MRLARHGSPGSERPIVAGSDQIWRELSSVIDDISGTFLRDGNALGLVRVTRAALTALRKSEHAAIVHTCSLVAPAGLPNRGLYSASKGAVLSLTQAMAADLIAEGIRVNAVNPGTADTP